MKFFFINLQNLSKNPLILPNRESEEPWPEIFSLHKQEQFSLNKTLN